MIDPHTMPADGLVTAGIAGLPPTSLVKVAVTFLAPAIVTLQVEVPVQGPVQPEKREPDAGVAVRVTAALTA